MPRPPSKKQKIIDDITEQIRRGQLKPGDQIPTTAALVNTYGVSVMTVRTAIAYLKAVGLVDAFPGLGTYVATPPAN